MLSFFRNFSPLAMKLNASDVGPTNAISSGLELSSRAARFRARFPESPGKQSPPGRRPSPAVRVFGDGLGHAARQRADAGVREKNFFARHGKFMPAQFFVAENFGQCHALT